MIQVQNHHIYGNEMSAMKIPGNVIKLPVDGFEWRKDKNTLDE